MTRKKKWDGMSRYQMVLARQVPEPEWYPAGLFGACISRSPKQNRSNICLACRSKQDKNPQIREKAYKAIVRPQLEYAAPVWDPHHRDDILKIEMVLFDVSLATTHPIQVSHTCLEHLADAPSSSGVLILDWFYFTSLFMDMLQYHSQLMSFPWPVPQELPIHLLTGSSVPGLIIININSTYLQLFRGTTFQPLLPPWQASTAVSQVCHIKP